MVAQTQKTNNMEKTYVYFSKANNEVFTVVAKNTFDAAKEVIAYCKATSKIICDDYVLMTTSDTSLGCTSGFYIPE